jgi:hypothetical protein
MVNKEVIKLDTVPDGKERITFDLRVKLGVNWNYDIVYSTMEPVNHKSSLFFINDTDQPKDLYSGLSSYLGSCFEAMDGVVDVNFNIDSVDVPKECQVSYDKFLKAHAESEKQKVKKEIEELENRAKQLKEKLKKL